MNFKKSYKVFPFLIGLIFPLCFISLNITGTDFKYFPGDLGDARFNMYILEHAYKLFTHHLINNSYWSAPFMFPATRLITYSDNLLGTALFYSIFRVIGFSREVSFQYWFILITILNFTAFYFFAKWLLKNRYAAVCGAVVFAFSMALQSQMTHAQTFTRFPIPIAIWMSLLFMEKNNSLHFFLSCFFVVFQFYCGFYLGFMLVISIAIVYLFIVIFSYKKISISVKNAKWRYKIIISFVLNALISLPLMLPYLKRAGEVGMNKYYDVLNTIPSPASYIFSQKGSLLWDSLSGIASDYSAWWDHQLFPGGITLICTIGFVVLSLIKIIRRNSFPKVKMQPSLLVFSLSGIVIFFLFVRFNDFSLYYFIFKLPGIGSMRSVTRIINVLLLFMAIATAFFVSKVIKPEGKYSFLIFILMISLLVADNYFYKGKAYITELRTSQNQTNNLIKKLISIPKGSIISYEPPGVNPNCQIDAMLASQSLGLICVNGYSATSPGSYTPYWNHPDQITREEWFKSVNFKPEKIYIVH